MELFHRKYRVRGEISANESTYSAWIASCRCSRARHGSALDAEICELPARLSNQKHQGAITSKEKVHMHDSFPSCNSSYVTPLSRLQQLFSVAKV